MEYQETGKLSTLLPTSYNVWGKKYRISHGLL